MVRLAVAHDAQTPFRDHKESEPANAWRVDRQLCHARAACIAQKQHVVDKGDIRENALPQPELPG